MLCDMLAGLNKMHRLRAIHASLFGWLMQQSSQVCFMAERKRAAQMTRCHCTWKPAEDEVVGLTMGDLHAKEGKKCRANNEEACLMDKIGPPKVASAEMRNVADIRRNDKQHPATQLCLQIPPPEPPLTSKGRAQIHEPMISSWRGMLLSSVALRLL